MASENTTQENASDDIPIREITTSSAQGWRSHGSEQEINESVIVNNRPLMVLNISKPRKEFGSLYRFIDRDAHDTLVEFRPYKDPNFEIRSLQRESGVQAILASKSTPTQTTWFRPVNMSVQYQPMNMNATDKDFAFTSQGMSDFIHEVYPRVENGLLQNITMDVFTDDYTTLVDEENSFGNKTDNQLKEFQSFADLVYSKSKSITSIDWQPGSRGVVSVSCTEKMSFDHRVDISGKVQNSVILIWNFADPIHPQFVLESPSDVICFRYNPTMPHLIAGGCVSGQVILWDISSALEDLRSKGRKKVGSSGKDEEESNAGHIPVVKNTYLSTIENSHHAAITDLRWIQPDMEIMPNNVLNLNTGNSSYQFITASSDGILLVWDLRTKGTKDQMRDKELPWTPHHKIVLNRMDGSGEYAPTKVCLGIKNMLFYATTEDGEILYGDWSPPPPRYDELTEAKHCVVKYAISRHCGPVVDLQRSPFFPDIILTVGDWSFNLWKEKIHDRPIFSSNYSKSNSNSNTNAYLASGRWSPTRPGVLFIAKSDGYVEIWDFLDRSHEPSMCQAVTSGSITSLEFAPPNTRGVQYLAVGDEAGTLHIMEVPRNLSRITPNERSVMDGFFEREIKRVSYTNARNAVRNVELQEKEKDAANKVMEEAEVQHDTTAETIVDEKAEQEYAKLEDAFKKEITSALPLH